MHTATCWPGRASLGRPVTRRRGRPGLPFPEAVADGWLRWHLMSDPTEPTDPTGRSADPPSWPWPALRRPPHRACPRWRWSPAGGPRRDPDPRSSARSRGPTSSAGQRDHRHRPAGDVALVDRLFDELVDGRRRRADRDGGRGRARGGDAAAADGRAAGRRADPQHPVQPRPDDPPEDAEPEALRRRDRRAHDRVRDRPGRYRQDLPGDGQGGAGAAGQAGQPDHPDPARGRGGRAAGLPARHPDREDRPLPAPALRRAARHGRPGVDPAADGRRRRSRWRRWPTCAAGR